MWRRLQRHSLLSGGAAPDGPCSLPGSPGPVPFSVDPQSMRARHAASLVSRCYFRSSTRLDLIPAAPLPPPMGPPVRSIGPEHPHWAQWRSRSRGTGGAAGFVLYCMQIAVYVALMRAGLAGCQIAAPAPTNPLSALQACCPHPPSTWAASWPTDRAKQLRLPHAKPARSVRFICCRTRSASTDVTAEV